MQETKIQMAAYSVQILRYGNNAATLSPSIPTASPPKASAKPSFFFFSSSSSESCSPTKRNFRWPSSNTSGCYTPKRLRVCCGAQDPDKESNGEEEPTESLFMKELRRRGMTSSSLLEETNRTGFGPNVETSKEESAFSQKNAVSTEVEKSLANQRERSMKLNSEGLEGLIPRAKLLLTIGGTFFLGFGPLILITIAFFSALYFYFGPSFVHDATKTPTSPPQYVDPYALLEEERISQMAPRVN